ncbi:MAG: radical SAM protein [Lentisphaeraceae bacterium]|nr:radical SAM protein [Lentisphaeraceae bacterium]
MPQKVLLVTPPLTQLNTPYPATAYLKYFLGGRGYEVEQVDLGIELILAIFSRDGLSDLFEQVDEPATENCDRIFSMQQSYINTVDAVIRYLQNKDLTLSHRICTRKFLPEGARFAVLEEMDEAVFGKMAVEDKARYLATLYMEDLGDFIRENIDSGFGFSRYQEKISVAASSFDNLHYLLENEGSYLDDIILKIFEEKMKSVNPDFCGFSIPFPGNLYGALICGRHLKENFPDCTVLMGGGYPNTELRDLRDPRVFKYVDYITLDDGELPLLRILEKFDGKEVELQRTFVLEDGVVKYFGLTENEDFPHTETGAPDYSGLPLDKYLNIIEIANPMHRLWNDGRWNKMTLAHGCYWKRCSFCDVTLDYIERYEEAPAKILVDRMETLINETGQSGFHFVDEAAPPSVLKELSLEIIRRGLVVSWWTNIRFERAFTVDLCKLLAAAGCIAVSGGLEVASNRLLSKMKKGTNLTQVVQSTNAFSSAGILVHSYLMYGFPTETDQETIDSLEVVRQLFSLGLIQSGFWHRFALTEHSPIGKNPEEYDVKITGPEFGGFAKNELTHEDPTGCGHGLYSEGLRKSLFNFMHGVGLEQKLNFWFDFKVPKTSHPSKLIQETLIDVQGKVKYLPNDRVLWLGGDTAFVVHDDNPELADLILPSQQEDIILELPAPLAEWLSNLLIQLVPEEDPVTFKEVDEYYQQYFEESIDSFTSSPTWPTILKAGLIILR